MKKIISFLLLTVMVASFCLFAGCSDKAHDKNPKNNSREDIAEAIQSAFDFKGGEYLPNDLKSYDKKEMLAPLLTRKIFGETGDGYAFNKDEGIKRKELAKISMYLYAALKGVEVHNLNPGEPIVNIGGEQALDISSLNYQQKWYIYAANSYGFVTFDGNKFSPEEYVSKEEVSAMLDKVKAKNPKTGQTLQAYNIELEKNYKTYTPNNTKIAKDVDVFVVTSGMTRGEQVALSTLQGLANRDEAKVFIKNPHNEMLWMLEYAQQSGYFNSINEPIRSLDTFITKYKGYAKGAVVFDETDPLMINLAVDYAAVTGRMVIDSSMIERVKALGVTDIVDLDDLGISTFLEYQQYAYDNLFQFMRRDALMFVYSGKAADGATAGTHDFERDYSVQQKIPTVWIPRSGEYYFDFAIQPLVGDILENFPANVPVMGFQGTGENVGLGEVEGNQFCGSYGKYTTVNDWIGNSSFNTCIPVSATKRKFTPKTIETPQYNSSKKYITLTMMESSDSPGYIGAMFKSRQWIDGDYRDEVSFNYAYGLSNYDLYPILSQYWNATKKNGDYFFSGVSGLGYCYPFLGYGDYGVMDDSGRTFVKGNDIISDHFKKTNYMLKKTGFELQGLYDYADGWWKESDYELIKTVIAPQLTNAKGILSGMARGKSVDLAGKNINEKVAHLDVFHNCTTFINDSAGLGSPEEVSKDAAAVDFLVKELRASTSYDGNFFNCMAYSWVFGQRRLKLVIDEMERLYPGEYEFVRADIFTKLYEESLKK